MERVHQIHRAFAALNIGMVFGGLAFGNAAIGLNVILVAVLFVALRAKFWFDDEAYLEDVSRGVLPGGVPFGAGMLLAVASWMAWAFAAFFIKDVELCATLMLVGFILSTFWVVAAMVKRGAYAEEVPWLFFNCFYALGFVLIAWRRASWNPFAIHVEGFTTAVLVFLFVVFLIDLGVTRILEQRRRSPAVGRSASGAPPS